MRSKHAREVVVRNTRAEDFDAIVDLCLAVYPQSGPWTKDQLASHLRVFPEGQFVAEEIGTGRLLGMASSLIVRWDDYEFDADWREFTSHGYFSNHDPLAGRTLYGAEVMVHPDSQGQGVGKKLYAARRELTRRLGLLRIRAGARLRGYCKYKETMSPEQYVTRVISGEIGDPTLSFQLRQGFNVIAVVQSYLRHDPESCGYAAVIEWLNPDLLHTRQAPFAAVGLPRTPAKLSAPKGLSSVP